MWIWIAMWQKLVIVKIRIAWLLCNLKLETKASNHFTFNFKSCPVLTFTLTIYVISKFNWVENLEPHFTVEGWRISSAHQVKYIFLWKLELVIFNKWVKVKIALKTFVWISHKNDLPRRLSFILFSINKITKFTKIQDLQIFYLWVNNSRAINYAWNRFNFKLQYILQE